MPSAPLLDRMELMDHEQIIANQTILRDKYEGFGEVRQARPAALFEGMPSKIKRPAPKLGEHSKEILDHLGISEETQNRMIKEGKVILSILKASSRFKMVGTAGFEPATTTPPVWCATRLRHAPII